MVVDPAGESSGRIGRWYLKLSKRFDVLILGGGIAGMTAALFAARAGLDTAIIEQSACGGLANWTHLIENFPSHQAINGMELMRRVQDQIAALGVWIDEAAEVMHLDLAGSPKHIETEEISYFAPAVILATGREPIRLAIESDFDGIHYCAVCDGPAYSGKEVIVLGGGNSGFDESLYLLSLGVTRINLIEAMGECQASESLRRRLAVHENVQILTSTRPVVLEAVGGRCRVTLFDSCSGATDELLVDGIFVYIGQRANSLPFRDLVRLDPEGYVIVGADQETSVPGVFAAGDVVRKRFRYLTTAMADGTIAGLAAQEYLREHQSRGRAERTGCA